MNGAQPADGGEETKAAAAGGQEKLAHAAAT